MEEEFELKLRKKWQDQLEESGEQSTITLSVIFMPLDHDDNVEDLRLSYFECQENNRVKLYQCADTPVLPIFEVHLNNRILVVLEYCHPGNLHSYRVRIPANPTVAGLV